MTSLETRLPTIILENGVYSLSSAVVAIVIPSEFKVFSSRFYPLSSLRRANRCILLHGVHSKIFLWLDRKLCLAEIPAPSRSRGQQDITCHIEICHSPKPFWNTESFTGVDQKCGICEMIPCTKQVTTVSPAVADRKMDCLILPEKKIHERPACCGFRKRTLKETQSTPTGGTVSHPRIRQGSTSLPEYIVCCVPWCLPMVLDADITT